MDNFQLEAGLIEPQNEIGKASNFDERNWSGKFGGSVGGFLNAASSGAPLIVNTALGNARNNRFA
ncbi:MAG: hypothetical protein P8Y48_13745 [Novosphingobium sp.]